MNEHVMIGFLAIALLLVAALAITTLISYSRLRSDYEFLRKRWNESRDLLRQIDEREELSTATRTRLAQYLDKYPPE